MGGVRLPRRVIVFGQLSSKGRAGILSMVTSWKFAQGPGVQFAFFVLGSHSGHRLALRTFFLSAGTCAYEGGGENKRKGKGKEIKKKKL
jgi:hypothetical protein